MSSKKIAITLLGLLAASIHAHAATVSFAVDVTETYTCTEAPSGDSCGNDQALNNRFITSSTLPASLQGTTSGPTTYANGSGSYVLTQDNLGGLGNLLTPYDATLQSGFPANATTNTSFGGELVTYSFPNPSQDYTVNVTNLDTTTQATSGSLIYTEYVSLSQNSSPPVTPITQALPGSYYLSNFTGGQFSAYSIVENPSTGDASLVYYTGTFTTVPLPAAAWLLLSGFGGLGIAGRRRLNATRPG
jgi:hypothetical protein